MLRVDAKPARLIHLTTMLMVCLSGCANLRLPAIDPYGRRVFLPRPAYTTLNNNRARLRDFQLIPNRPVPAFTRPAPVPLCNTGGCRTQIQPFAKRRRPLLDCLFGPEEGSDCRSAGYVNTDPCSVGAINQAALPLSYSDNCLPVASCSPVPAYDPCADPCLDSVVLGQNSQPLAIGPQPNYVQPQSSPGLMIPRNRAAAYSTAPGTRGVYAGRLQLDPQRLIAPVGSEVVLRAGLCGDDGYLINKQPIEWSLSQDSVGSFVEVDEFKKPFWRRMLHKPPEKRSGDYAIGRTSTAPQVLTRGTLDPSDDIWLAEGQTWISLTSASEGVSHVSAVAPSAAGWGDRRQLGSIHWIDGRWQFPQPTFAAVGRPHQITTNVRRSTTGDPVQGWIVRYEIQDNSAANLANAKRTLDVVTDEHGNASVNVSPSVNGPGITPIGIQVIRVGNRVGDYNRVLVGQGQTSITWTESMTGGDPYPSQPAPTVPADNTPTVPAAPRLDVDIVGPSTVTAGRDATYQITVDNIGTVAATNTQLSVEIPSGMEYVNASSPGNQFGSDVRWNLDPVPSQGRATHQVILRAIGAGPFRVCARTNSGGTVSGRDCVDTAVSQASTPNPPTQPAPPVNTGVRLAMEGPSEATVGQRIRYRVTITNPSRQIARAKILDEFDPGLGHSQGGSPIEYPLTLGPGEVRNVFLDFTAKTPGQQCHTLTLTSSDTAPQSKRACVNIIARGNQPPGSSQPAPDPFQTGQVRVITQMFRNGVPAPSNLPPVVQVGEPLRIQFRVENTGQTTLRDLMLVDEFDPNLFPIETTQGESQNQLNQNRLVWRIPRLDPGRFEDFGITTKAERLATRSCHTLSVYSDDGQSIARGEACFQVVRDGSPVNIRLQPPTNAATSILSPMTPVSMRVVSSRTATELSVEPSDQSRSNASANDSLRVSVSDLGDPGYVDQRLTYVVVIRNNKKTSDRNVVLTVTLPEGARYETAINPPMIRARKTTPDRRTVEFLPITELRGDESATFRIVATSERVGTGVFRAEVTSARTQLPVVTTEETTFFQK